MNGARGEVALAIGGREHTLCLTLGALAEIETKLGCRTLSELDVRMRALSAADMLVVVQALMAGTESDLLCDADIAPGAAAKAIAEAFRLGLAS